MADETSLPPLALRRLQYFVIAVEEGTVTRAAATLRVSQPSLSQQLLTLEGEVGAQLLDRGPRQLTLTPAGRALLPHAREALAAAARGRRVAREAAGLQSGVVYVATTQSLAVGVLPIVLDRWRRETPELTVRVREHRHLRELHEDVRSGRADVALAQRSPGWSGEQTPAGYEELVIVLSAQDAVLQTVGRRGIALQSLAEREWVLPQRGNGLSETVEQACAAAGFSPREATRSSSVWTMVRLAAAGLGPTLVPSHVIAGLDGVTALSCDPPMHRELVAFGRSSAAGLADRLGPDAARITQAA